MIAVLQEREEETGGDIASLSTTREEDHHYDKGERQTGYDISLEVYPEEQEVVLNQEEAGATDDAQYHRRLKRVLPSRKNNHHNVAPEKSAINSDNTFNHQLPPILSNNIWGDPFSRLEFANEHAELLYKTASTQFENIILRDLWDPLGEVFSQQQQELQHPTRNQSATSVTASKSLPSKTTTTTPPTSLTKVPFEPQVEYLGVLLDGGRHYFPIPWLKRLIVYLHRLRFNLIHFHLTDDQAFNVRLDSYPELAFPSVATSVKIIRREDEDTTTTTKDNYDKSDTNHGDDNGHTKESPLQNNKFRLETKRNDQVYTPQELRDLVAFAKGYNITIIPEINMPGHAGAWAGIPNLIVTCPEFICDRGYGIPLNIEHPELKTILTGVLGEVLDIFDNPPLLHLGGDEVFMSSRCFSELGKFPFSYTDFEGLLQEVLDSLGYSSDKVLRWEETGPAGGSASVTLSMSQNVVGYNGKAKPQRTGNIEHYWQTLPGSKAMTKEEAEQRRFFVSRGLYMDVNHDDGAEDIYNYTREAFQDDKGSSFHPMGIIAGTFELGTDFWMQRNVASRLIAVSMGASKVSYKSSDDFWQAYNTTCRQTLQLPAAVCDLQGFVAVSKSRYQRDWKNTWNDWTDGICDRLTTPKRTLTMSRGDMSTRTTFEEANRHFWSTFKTPLADRQPVVRQNLKLSKAGAVQDIRRTATSTGVLLDLVNSMRPLSHVAEFLEKFVAPLGNIQLAQLRLADNYGFGYGFRYLGRVSFSPMETFSNLMPRYKSLTALVDAAKDLGIELYPEISLSTDAGGWVQGGFALNCPQAFCNATSTSSPRIMANNIGSPKFLPVAYSVIRELMDVFSTSRYIHLGSDERTSHTACFQEDGRYDEPPFASFEQNLTKLLREYLGMTTQHILRWENDEKVRYPDRTGDITQYRSTIPFTLPKVRPGEPFFVTLELLAPPKTKSHDDKDDSTVFYEIYKHTRQLMALQPLGILAEIRDLDEVTQSTHHLGLRLISFSLGTRVEQDDYSPTQFQDHLVKECRRAKFDGCEQIATAAGILNMTIPEEKMEYHVESNSFRKEVCDAFTVVKVTRQAKEIVSQL